MILVTLLDERYSSMEFEFGSLEEASIFAESALKASNKLLKITISVNVKEGE
jgi:hypothetical protein